MPVGKRTYRSLRREEQARQTRDRIIAAAQELFVRNGFEATSVEAIARRAKVAAPTIYAVFHSKRGLLGAVADRVSENARRLARVEGVWELGDAHEQIRLFARFQRILGETGSDMLQMARSASGIDLDAAAVWREREEARRMRAKGVAREWSKRGLLRPGLDVSTAADIMWVLADPYLYTLFVKECGWSGARFERWFRETFEAQLLA